MNIIRSYEHGLDFPIAPFFLIASYSPLCYICNMTITQTIEIPADRRITLEVPREVPTGPVILTFTPKSNEPKKVPVFGCAKGQFKIAEDFDAPLDDFKDYM